MLSMSMNSFCIEIINVAVCGECYNTDWIHHPSSIMEVWVDERTKGFQFFSVGLTLLGLYFELRTLHSTTRSTQYNTNLPDTGRTNFKWRIRGMLSTKLIFPLIAYG